MKKILRKSRIWGALGRVAWDGSKKQNCTLTIIKKKRESRINNGDIISLILIQFHKNHFQKAAILLDKFISKQKLKEKSNYGKHMMVY